MPLVWDILHASMNAKGGQFNVASLENMEKDHSFLFLKKNLLKIFFFLNLKKLYISKELKILIFFF